MQSDKITLRKIQLELLYNVQVICKKYDIRWFAVGGTLLGAVRHKGYIPWDDDLDIGMLQQDYEKFIKIASSELPNNMFVDNFYVDNSPYSYTKIRMKGTAFIERKMSNKIKHNEIFIDIFPYYYVPKSKFPFVVSNRLCNLLKQLLQIKNGIKPWRGENVLTVLKFIPLRCLSYCIPISYIKNVILRIQNKLTDSMYVCEQSVGNFGKKRFFKTDLCDLIDYPFENITVPGPKNFSRYLSTAYGNYMELPPIESRKGHDLIELKFSNFHSNS